ncbi:MULTISPECIES: urease accessory protein UreE [Arthrobacter]|uniref:urease accessory protein UreE n=1 Tax=Arthrobacter TaxID=1663 RepID=UPI000D137C4F|nr:MULTISPECIES: urease accessory protein UreE [Arthrobacter]PSS45391.1 urease accessory protein UreE [Arthrobacter woluwensis]QTF71639.1 urease accessory protein UreE [Arthrobacter woluwensis]
MIVTSILGNIHDEDHPFPAGHREKVTLPVADLAKRIQRVTSDHGRELGIRLPAGSPDLRDGDVLFAEEGNAVVVAVEASDVLVIAPRSIGEALFTAHSLGNRHLQAQFFGPDSDYAADVMVCQYDHTVEDFLNHHQVPYSRQERVMAVPFRHAEHTH